jgi:hypothetical protein
MPAHEYRCTERVKVLGFQCFNYCRVDMQLLGCLQQ